MKPILFNTDMVRALLAERKSVTRRVVKPQPKEIYHGGTLYEDDGDLIALVESHKGHLEQVASPYHPGDILYVAEAWKCVGTFGELGYEVEFRDGQRVKFKFESRDRAKKWAKYRDKPSGHWQSPYFMPREAARIFLRVTDVRMERLQEILVDGILREGIDVDIPPICKQAMDPNYPTDEQRAAWERMNQTQKDKYVNNKARHTYMGWCDYADRLFLHFKNVWNSTIKPADLALYGGMRIPGSGSSRSSGSAERRLCKVNREILFRGKRLDNGEWVYGSYARVHDTSGNPSIIPYGENGFASVDPDTVGQYTGLTDKNGVRIFDGDIVHTKEWQGCDKSVVIFESGMFKAHNMSLCTWSIPDYRYEVIGNIHDNPELLKGGAV